MLGIEVDLILLMRLFGSLIALDFLTGIMASAKLGKLKSRTCSNGLFRSMGEVVVLGLFALISSFIPNVHDYLEMFMVGFVIKEIMSICENLIKLDVWMPKAIIKFLASSVEKADEGNLTIKK